VIHITLLVRPKPDPLDPDLYFAAATGQVSNPSFFDKTGPPVDRSSLFDIKGQKKKISARTWFASLTIGIMENWNSGIMGSGLRLADPTPRRG